MLDHLDGIQPSPRGSLAEGAKNFCLRNPGKGIVVLVSDLLDKSGYEPGLRYLIARNLDVYVIHVLAPEELDPDLSGDLRLVDCEDGDEAEITANGLLLARYRQTLAAFQESARQFCLRRGVAYAAANTSVPIEQLVSGCLRRGGLVR
jgi:hypothetical protein